MLLRDSLVELTSTPYFNRNLNEYAKGIVEVISYVLQNYSTLSPIITANIADIIWNASKYLRGSVSTEIPYEVEYSLNLALNDWVNDKCVISTALLNDRDYHFFPLDTWKYIKNLLPDFEYRHFDALLIQIALPRIYRHKPLYYIPLYHELGHFIDNHFKITDATFLIDPAPVGRTTEESRFRKEVAKNHRMEYFADLFSACYLGHENYKFLEKISDSPDDSISHPSTPKRVTVAQDFLSGSDNDIVNLFQKTLDGLGLSRLKIKYSNPDLGDTFGNLRPCTLVNTSDVHGIFESAWRYYEAAISKQEDVWSEVDEEDISRIINDLTEKSIRNRVIVEKWNNAITK